MSRPENTIMVLNRNFTLRSTLGHMLTFAKNVPMTVPASMVRACAEIGAERVDGKNALIAEETTTFAQPVDPGHRLEDIRSTIIDLVETNDSREFTAAGIPKTTVVSEKLGYKVDRTEIATAWQTYQEDKANDSE